MNKKATSDYDVFDPARDLKLERVVDVPPELVWKAWTTPEHLVHWFCPKPWQTTECVIDLRPGGIFYTVMESPEGERYPGAGCYLEIVENRRLVWTNSLEPGFRPAAPDPDASFHLAFTAIIDMEPAGDGRTKYTARALHLDPKDCKAHADMGFEHGWGTVLDQLVEYMKAL